MPDTIKIIVVGNAETGKTAIIKRVVKGQFSDEYEGTIGVDFLTKQMNTHGKTWSCRFGVWHSRHRRGSTAIN